VFSGEPAGPVVCLGEAMLVLLADDGLPLAAARSFRRSVAGAEANVAAVLARMGVRSSWTSRVGDDVAGRVVVETLRGAGVGVDGVVVDPQAPTGLLWRGAATGRPAEVAYYRDASAATRLSPADLDEDAVRGAAVLHLSGITALLSDSAWQTCEVAVRLAAGAGVPVSFDPNLRRRFAGVPGARGRLTALAAAADVVVAGDDEAVYVTGAADGPAAARHLLRRGARVVALKHGRHGSTLFSRDAPEPGHVPAGRLPVVDTVGAGDAFCAGLLEGLVRGRDPAEAHRRAAAVAGCVVSTLGDTEGAPTAAEVDRLVADTQETLR
jgi:2-dehydro-3-deoxygluconokinase